MKNFKIFLIAYLSIIISCFDKSEILKTLVNDPKMLFITYYTLFEKHNEYDINSIEGVKRYRIFKDNLNFIQESNLEQGIETYGFTPFVDMTNDEFRDRYTMKSDVMNRIFSTYTKSIEEEKNEDSINSDTLQEDEVIDYMGLHGPIKDQGNCGSCWAFASLSVVEAKYMQISGKYRSFSEQYLVDCFGRCYGTDPARALEFIQENGVLDTKLKPYKAKEFSCDLTKEKERSAWIVREYTNSLYIFMKPEQRKIRFHHDLKTLGSLVAAIDGASKEFQFFRPKSLDVPINSKNCKEENHAITVIGKKNNLYYCRNSWGIDWGYNGYFTVPVDQDCFISNSSSGVSIGSDLNPASNANKFEIPDYDINKISDNEKCNEIFFINCDFMKVRKLKNCELFTNADEHFGKDFQIKGIKNTNYKRHWGFYFEPNCKGPSRKFKEFNEKNPICFEFFNFSNIKSGHAIDRNFLNINKSHVLLSNDFCFGGKRILVKNSSLSVSWGPEFIPKSVIFSDNEGVQGLLCFEGENFTGKSCFIRKEINNDTFKEDGMRGNVTCDVKEIKSVLLLRGQIK